MPTTSPDEPSPDPDKDDFNVPEEDTPLETEDDTNPPLPTSPGVS